MSQTQAKEPAPPSPAHPSAWRTAGKRLLLVALIGTTIVWMIHRSSERLDHAVEPAGFARGMLHGALMPMAMPNLLLGQDVTIYAPQNRGRLYKLGYTVGVNGCGALFFGLFFWRIQRWRKAKVAATT